MRTYQSEFPSITISQIVLDALEKIGAKDQSWHNDAYPSFVVWGVPGKTEYEILWIADESRAARESPQCKRFMVARYDVNNKHVYDAVRVEDAELAAEFLAVNYGEDRSASYSTATIERLAREFSKQLRQSIGEAAVQKVNALNALETGNACHSHDFIDANEVMLSAMSEIGVAPDGFNEALVNDEKRLALWDRAWTMAKANRFYV